jgi:hypothetical protein
VYIDQIGAASAYTCFDPSHNHSTGGGDWWAEGEYQMIEKCQQASVPNQRALVTESNAETYMGHLPGYLVIAGFTHCTFPNMFSAVYGGYMVPFGRIFEKPDIENPDIFAVKMAQMFVNGAQLGWFSLGGSYGIYDIVQPKYPYYINTISKAIII